MRVSTIENMLNIIEHIDKLQAESNAVTRDLLDAEHTLTDLARTARERILKHAIKALFDSRVGVNAAFVRMIAQGERA